MSKTKPPDHDLDDLADFLLKTVRTGSIDIMGAMKMGPVLKRKAGSVDHLVGRVVQRHCREDEKTAALLTLAAQQSPAFAKLADRLGLIVKDATPDPSEPEVKDAKPC